MTTLVSTLPDPGLPGSAPPVGIPASPSTNTSFSTKYVQSTYSSAYVTGPGVSLDANRTIKVGVARPLTGRLLYVDQSYTGTTQTGSSTEPFKTISAAISALNTLATTIIIREGIYREFLNAKGKAPASLVIQAQEGQTVFIKGSDVFNSGWTNNGGGLYSRPYTNSQIQMAFINRQMLQQFNGSVVGDANTYGYWFGRAFISGIQPTSLPNSSFWHDLVGKKIWLRTPGGVDPNAALTELAVRPRWVDLDGVSSVTIRDINFEHSNTTSFFGHGQGAIQMYNDANVTMDNISTSLADGTCISLGPITSKNIKILNSDISYCGHVGLGGAGDSILVSNNRISHNNIRAFSENWHAGGMKFSGGGGMTNSTVTNNEISYNYGPGFWCDYCNVGNNQLINNLVIHNKGQGFHIEVSTGNAISGNYFFGNNLNVYIREGSFNTITSNMMMMANTWNFDFFDGPRVSNVPGGCLCNNSATENKIIETQIRIQNPLKNASENNTFISPNTLLADGKTLAEWQIATGFDRLSQAYLNKDPNLFTVNGQTLAARKMNRSPITKAEMDMYFSLIAK